MKKLLPQATISILSILFVILFAACKHESTESKAELTFVSNLTSNGQEIPVEGAIVKISLDTSSSAKRDPSFPRYKTTDVHGKAEFVFSNGIVVNIDAYKEIGPKDTISNKTFIAINTGDTEEKKILLKRK